MSNSNIDFNNEYSRKVLYRMFRLFSKNEDRYIVFNTDEYDGMLDGCSEGDIICTATGGVEKVLSLNSCGVLTSRVKKKDDIKGKRTQEKAEIFTPKRLCEYMNGCAILETLGVARGDMLEYDVADKVNSMILNDGWTAEEYDYFISRVWLEACCGEGPFVVNRYDASTGDDVQALSRVGFLDRKLQLISRYRTNFDEWFCDVLTAYKTTYAYEWQGDSLLIARYNMFMTFVDYYFENFIAPVPEDALIQIADIIATNTLQMDGRNWTYPNTEEEVVFYNWNDGRAESFPMLLMQQRMCMF